MPTPRSATGSVRPSSPEPVKQVVEVGPFVARPGHDASTDVVYSVTLPSGFVATGPERFPPEPVFPLAPPGVPDEPRTAWSACSPATGAVSESLNLAVGAASLRAEQRRCCAAFLIGSAF